MNRGIPTKDLDDARVDLLIHLGAPDCVDPNAIDHAELIAHASGPVSAEVPRRVGEHLKTCPCCSALFAEYRRTPGDISPRNRARRIATTIGVGVVALAASIAGIVSYRSRGEVPAYRFVDVRGRVAATMSAGRASDDRFEPETEAEDQIWTFAPAAQIEIAVAPRDGKLHAGRVHAAVFGLRDGKLERVPATRVTREGMDDYPAFRLRAARADLLPACPSEGRFFFVVGGSERELEELAGRSIEEAQRAIEGLRWLEATLRCTDGDR